jgi:hypothetical protein
MVKKRDYKAEYTRRIERGLEKGFSRSQARGHGTSSTSAPRTTRAKRYDRRLETGLKKIRSGQPLSKAARSIAVAPERLSKYVKQTGVGKKKGQQWTIGTDRRKREMPLFTSGQIQTITLKNYKDSQSVGKYMAVVSKFLSTNDESVLREFVGESVLDVKGKRHSFETRPNVLYRLSSTQTETFEEVYRIVA